MITLLAVDKVHWRSAPDVAKISGLELGTAYVMLPRLKTARLVTSIVEIDGVKCTRYRLTSKGHRVRDAAKQRHYEF